MSHFPKKYSSKARVNKRFTEGEQIGNERFIDGEQNPSFSYPPNGLRRSLSHGVFASFTLLIYAVLCGHRLLGRSELPLEGASR